MELPPIVDKAEWQHAHQALPAKENEATRARDAERRRRQGTSQDSPAGYPQTPPYGWWRPHGAYEVQA